MSQFRSIRKRAILFSGAAIIALAGSGIAFQHYTNASAQPAQMPAVMPAIPVTVRTVNPDDVMIWSEFSGRMTAVDFAEIRPEVSGRITQVRFTDGQSVKAGEVLFVIDPRPYEAALAKAQANLVTARTNAEFANTEFERAANLVKTQAIAQRFYDERANGKRVADAAVLRRRSGTEAGRARCRPRLCQGADLGTAEPRGNHGRQSRRKRDRMRPC